MAAGIELIYLQPERERDICALFESYFVISLCNMVCPKICHPVQTINNANFDAQLRLHSKLAQVGLQADMYNGGTAESFTAAPGWKGQDVGR